jgi:hypothetical protein
MHLNPLGAYDITVRSRRVSRAKQSRHLNKIDILWSSVTGDRGYGTYANLSFCSAFAFGETGEPAFVFAITLTQAFSVISNMNVRKGERRLLRIAHKLVLKAWIYFQKVVALGELEFLTSAG